MKKLPFLYHLAGVLVLVAALVAVSCSNFFGDMMIKQADSRLSATSGSLRLLAGGEDLLAAVFSADKTAYDVSVGTKITSVQLTAQTADTAARKAFAAYLILDETETAVYTPVPVSGDGLIADLPFGTTSITLTIYAEDDDFQTVYTVNVTRVRFTDPPVGFSFRIELKSAMTDTTTPAETVPGYTWNQSTPVFPTIPLSGNVVSFGVNTVITSGADTVAKIEYAAKKKDGTVVPIAPQFGEGSSNPVTSANLAVISSVVQDGAKLPDGWTTITVKLTLKNGAAIGPYTYYVSKPDVSDPTLTALRVKRVAPSGGQTITPAVTAAALLPFNYNKSDYEFHLPTEAGNITLEAVTSFTNRPNNVGDGGGAAVTASAVNYRKENGGTAEKVAIRPALTHTDDANTFTDLIIDGDKLPAGKTVITIQATSADKTNTKKYTAAVIKPEADEVAFKELKSQNAIANINVSPSSPTSNIDEKTYALAVKTAVTELKLLPDAYYKPAEVTYTANNRRISGYADGKFISIDTTVRINNETGTIPLDDGVTTITATVSATDKNSRKYTKNYTVTATLPEANNAELDSIVLKGGGFDDQKMALVTDKKLVNTYYAVQNTVSEITADITTVYKNATVAVTALLADGYNAATIGLVSNNQGTENDPLKTVSISDLQAGYTMLEITVKPQISSGSDSKKYYVRIYKVIEDATVILRSLTFNRKDEVIGTDPDNLTDEVLACTVVSDTSVPIQLKLFNPKATVDAVVYRSVQPLSDPQYSATLDDLYLGTCSTVPDQDNQNSYIIGSLETGSKFGEYGRLTIVKFTVRAGSGGSKKEKNYYVKIYRKLSSDATLKSLAGKYDGGVALGISPAFNKATLVYAADTDINSAGLRSFTFTAETGSPLATLEWQSAIAEYVSGYTQTMTPSISGKSITISGYDQVKTVTITVIVTAEDGVTKKTYTVTISNQINKPVTPVNEKVAGLDYWRNDDANQIAYSFGAKKAAGYRSVQDNEHGPTLTGVDIVGKKSGGEWVASAFGYGGWQYFVNRQWVSVTANDTFVKVPGTNLEFAVKAEIIYSGLTPYVIITHKIRAVLSGAEVSFGAYSDTLINRTATSSSGDDAPFNMTSYGCTLTGDSHTFALYVRNAAGVDNVDKLWLGGFENIITSLNPLTDFMTAVNEKQALTSGSVTNSSNDSAAAYGWENVSLAAGQTVEKKIRISLGEQPK